MLMVIVWLMVIVMVLTFLTMVVRVLGAIIGIFSMVAKKMGDKDADVSEEKEAIERFSDPKNKRGK